MVYFDAQIVLTLTSVNPSSWPLCLFHMPAAIDHILAFCHKRFQVDLTLSFPHRWNQSILQADATPFKWKVVLGSQAVGVECAHCY